MQSNGIAPSGRRRWRCDPLRQYCYSTTEQNPKVPRDQRGNRLRAARTSLFKRSLNGSKTFVITAAQNATPAHRGFLAACKALCDERNGELVVIPLRYKNPTSQWTDSQANEEVWDSTLTPYLCSERKKLNQNLMLLGDIKTQPTAINPLSGYDAITHGESGIFGHTKLALRTIPTPQSALPKILTTTGACTVRNFTDSRAGKLGEFHYTLGAALVEIHGKRFHLRQINADKETGDFIDLTTRYSGSGKKSEAGPAQALVMGDTHVDFIDPDVEAGTFGPDGMVKALHPKTLVWHDLLDGHAVNPHHMGNPFSAIAKLRSSRNDAKAEMMRALDFVDKHTRDGHDSVIIPSNHDEFLTRWILNRDWRLEPGNAEFYLETALEMVRRTKMGPGGVEYPSPITYWGRKVLPRVKFLEPDESHTIAGIECGMHGHRGPNGSRGSIRNLRRIGVKSIIGHSHAPGIDEGCYQTGTSTRLRLEYNTGPSGWLNTHAVIYANGKRALLNIIGGEWRL
jgi:hypothetical protein